MILLLCYLMDLPKNPWWVFCVSVQVSQACVLTSLLGQILLLCVVSVKLNKPTCPDATDRLGTIKNHYFKTLNIATTDCSATVATSCTKITSLNHQRKCCVFMFKPS